MDKDLEYRLDPKAPVFSLDMNAPMVGHVPAVGPTRERFSRTGSRPKASCPAETFSYAQLAEQIAKMSDEQRAGPVRTYDRFGNGIWSVSGVFVATGDQDVLEPGVVYLRLA